MPSAPVCASPAIDRSSSRSQARLSASASITSSSTTTTRIGSALSIDGLLQTVQRAGRLGRDLAGHRQDDVKGRSTSDLALGPDPAAVQLDDLSDDRQPESGPRDLALRGRLDAGVAVEHRVERLE